MIGDPSMLRLIRKVEALGRIFPTLDLSIEEITARRLWKNPRSDFDDRNGESDRSGDRSSSFIVNKVRIEIGVPAS